MKDISNRGDIEVLVNSFYDKVLVDATIGYLFTDIAAVDWILHLPKMYRFLGNGAFGKNELQG